MSSLGDWAPYLRKGEEVLWTGQPTHRLFVFRASDLFVVPFSLLWGGFALFWNISVWTTDAPALFTLWGILFTLWGIPFLVVGAYITVGRFFYDAHIRRNTVYALTSESAFIAKSVFGRSLREQPLGQSLAISFDGKDEGAVTFGERPGVFSQSGQVAVWSGEDGSFTFRAIANPEELYHKAQRAKEMRP